MPKRLFVDRIESIGAVEDGDNPHAEILLFKSRKQTTTESSGDTSDGGQMTDLDLSALDEDVQKQIEAHIAEAVEAAVAERVANDDDGPDPLPDDLPEAVTKRLSEQDAAIAKARKETEAAEARIAKMEEDAATARWTERAGELTPLLGKPGDVADVLKQLAADSPEAFDKFNEMLNVPLSVAQATDSDLFREIGDGGDDASARSQIEAIAKEKRDKNPDLTAAQARAEAWDENPHLVALSRNEGSRP